MIKRQNTRGFTLIEVILFLAITGLMVTGILAGINGAVNRERYTDAVNSFQDFIQGQYNLVDNVQNNRSANYRCDSGGVVDTGTVSRPARGASNCALIGRYIKTTDSTGRNLVSDAVIATADVTSSRVRDSATEADLINALGLRTNESLLASERQTYTLAWDTRIYTNPSNVAGSTQFSMVIIRLPYDGLMRTFTYTGTPSTTVMGAISAAGSSDAKLCVDPRGLVSSPANGVRIKAAASNAGSVQFITGSEGCAV